MPHKFHSSDKDFARDITQKEFKEDAIKLDITDFLLAKLKETSARCEQLSKKVDDQERHATVAEVPKTKEDRAKAKGAKKSIKEKIKSLSNLTDLSVYMTEELPKREGLFYRIYRGKLNSHFVPALPEPQRSQCTYKGKFTPK